MNCTTEQPEGRRNPVRYAAGEVDLATRSALAWLADQPITDQRIGVVVGNERALRFYARCGFAPWASLLRPQCAAT